MVYTRGGCSGNGVYQRGCSGNGVYQRGYSVMVYTIGGTV